MRNTTFVGLLIALSAVGTSAITSVRAENPTPGEAYKAFMALDLDARKGAWQDLEPTARLSLMQTHIERAIDAGKAHWTADQLRSVERVRAALNKSHYEDRTILPHPDHHLPPTDPRDQELVHMFETVQWLFPTRDALQILTLDGTYIPASRPSQGVANQ